MDVSKFFSRYMTLNNDGVSKEMNIDGSVSDQVFQIKPGPLERYVLDQMHFSMRDGGSWRPDDFGAMAGGITNGLLFQISGNAGPMTEIFSGTPITTNADFDLFSTPVFRDWQGSETTMKIRQSFQVDKRKFILDGSLNQSFEMLVRDNLGPLSLLRARVSGWIFRLDESIGEDR